MNAETITKHNSIFDTKEQYVAFRANWKRIYAEGLHKPKRIEYQHSGDYVWDKETKRTTYIPGGIGHHMVSPLTVWHHLIFNLALGRDPLAKAFRPVEKVEKWNRPNLWHAIGYTNGAEHTYDLFGDTLTSEQKAKLQTLVQQFRDSM